MNSAEGAGNAKYKAELLVKGNSQWREIAPNGWQNSWPVYSQTGITMNNKIFFFGKITFIKAITNWHCFHQFRWLECCQIF